MLDHPNIAKIYEWYEDENRYMLINELVKGGELFELITTKKFESREAAIIIKQICSTINYMHNPNNYDDLEGKFGIVHRDLKPENILLTDSDDMLPEIKLIDFGTSKKFEYHEFTDSGFISSTKHMYPIGLKEKVGTLNYMAPEVMSLETGHHKKEHPSEHPSFEEYRKHFYSEKVDVWSIGVIAYVLLTGKQAFNDNATTKALMDEIKGFIDDPKSSNWTSKANNKTHIFEEQVFTRLPDDAKEFVKGCLKKNPAQRASCEELLNSTWMKNLQDDLI